MKIAIRLSAATLVIAAAVAGNSMAKPATIATAPHSNLPGPTPYCNPFTQQCPPMR
jgi:hypothetical protein